MLQQYGYSPSLFYRFTLPLLLFLESQDSGEKSHHAISFSGCSAVLEEASYYLAHAIFTFPGMSCWVWR